MNKHLGVPRVGFVTKPMFGDPDDTVEHSAFFVTLVVFAKPCLDFEINNLLKFLFIPVQLGGGAQSCEVIAVYNYGDVLLGMSETAR